MEAFHLFGDPTQYYFLQELDRIENVEGIYARILSEVHSETNYTVLATAIGRIVRQDMPVAGNIINNILAKIDLSEVKGFDWKKLKSFLEVAGGIYFYEIEGVYFPIQGDAVLSRIETLLTGIVMLLNQSAQDEIEESALMDQLTEWYDTYGIPDVLGIHAILNSHILALYREWHADYTTPSPDITPSPDES
jgi:hypothetical protein